MPNWPIQEFSGRLLLPALYLSSESCTVVLLDCCTAIANAVKNNHKLTVRITDRGGKPAFKFLR